MKRSVKKKWNLFLYFVNLNIITILKCKLDFILLLHISINRR